jgi:hypothetical protein
MNDVTYGRMTWPMGGQDVNSLMLRPWFPKKFPSGTATSHRPAGISVVKVLFKSPSRIGLKHGVPSSDFMLLFHLTFSSLVKENSLEISSACESEWLHAGGTIESRVSILSRRDRQSARTVTKPSTSQKRCGCTAKSATSEPERCCMRNDLL